MKPGNLAVWGAICLAVGCSKSEFELVPVSGTVTLDSEPIAGGVINFQPVASADATTGGPGSSGRINDEGRFSLTTVRGQPGAVVGTHKVKIFSFSPESPVVSDTDSGPSKERVPERYNYRSKLTFEVSTSGTDQADFALTTEP